MTALAEVNILIDLAKSIAGSDYKVAKMIGATPQQISDWRYGRKAVSPEDQALIASVAGLNAEQVALRAMVSKHEGTPKGDRLMKVLGKASLATGAVLATAGANAQAIYSTIQTTGALDLLHLVWNTMSVM